MLIRVKGRFVVNIYVGNLPFSATDADLRSLFGEYGTIVSASVISDRDTGRSRGFGRSRRTAREIEKRAPFEHEQVDRHADDRRHDDRHHPHERSEASVQLSAPPAGRTLHGIR